MKKRAISAFPFDYAVLTILLLGGLAFYLREHGIREQIEAKTAFYHQSETRYVDVVDRMSRLGSVRGADITPFQEIADLELQNLLRLDRERDALRAELWLSSGRR